MDIAFLGAAGTVTGSKYLVTDGSTRVLVDCGLFQGYKALRERNWAPFPVDPSSIDAVVLTHAHLDHSGYLPRLVKEGYSGPVYATPPTVDLAGILLPDSGHLQEEDAEYANKKGFSKHRPALPLYTEQDAYDSLASLAAVDFHRPFTIGDLTVEFIPAGHILGAAMIRITGDRTVVFSGDVGRPNDPIMYPPEGGLGPDVLVCESTYGNRVHEHDDPLDILEGVVSKTANRGGVVLIPAFAVGRSQAIIYLLHRLVADGRIPALPIYLNSPMAVRTTDLYLRYHRYHRLDAGDVRAIERDVRLVQSVEESKSLNHLDHPAVIVSASGMLTGGRVLHHLASYGPDPRSTLLFVGYQAGGTRGARILSGESEVKVHGSWVPIRCDVAQIHGLSAHADANELLDWLGSFSRSPEMTYITHGEPDASEALRVRVQHELGWKVRVPLLGDQVSLVKANAP